MKRLKKPVIFVLKLSVTVLLVYFIIRKVGLSEIKNSFTSVHIPLLIAFVYSLLFNFFKALKWYYLVREVQPSGVVSQEQEGAGAFNIGNAFKSYLAGMAGGVLTPGRVGEIARIVYLEKQPKSLIAYLVAVDKLFDIAAVLMVALPGVYYFFKVPGLIGLIPVLGILAVVIYFPHLPIRWMNRLLKNTRVLAKVRERLSVIETGIQSLSLSFKAKFFSGTILCYGLVILEFQQLVLNYQDCGFVAILLCQPLIMLTNILPVTVGGIGVREGTAVILLAGFGITKSAALSAAFMLFILNTVFPALVGVMFLFFRKGVAPLAIKTGAKS